MATDKGPERFTMRWTQSQAIDFGENGKLIIDSEENRFLVRDVEALPERDRERFLQYVTGSSQPSRSRSRSSGL